MNVVMPKGEKANRPYQAFGAARKLWSCRDDEILIDGPAGTGKTRAILEKVHFCCCKYPGMRALIVRKTRESMTESVLVTLEEKVFPEDSDMLLGPKRNLRQAYHYPNGSELVVGGLDKSTKIMSTEYDMICTFESTELTEDDYESLTTRLRNGVMPYHQIIADCNPGNPHHWLNKRANADRMTRLISRHEDNPVLYDQKRHGWTPQGEKYIARLDRLTGPRYLRLRKGIWAQAEGIVYEDYDANIHLVPKRVIPKSWRRIRVFDFGYKNPLVCQWWAIDPDGDMWMYRELYMTKKLVSEHAAVVKLYSKDETYEANIADHDAEDRATLHECGIFTIPAFKAIQIGIKAVAKRLKKDERGLPSLYIMRDALIEKDTALEAVGLPFTTSQEFDSYIWPKDPDTNKPIKEEPVKKDDHGMDAMRYAVAFVDNIQGMTIHVEAAEAVPVFVKGQNGYQN